MPKKKASKKKAATTKKSAASKKKTSRTLSAKTKKAPANAAAKANRGLAPGDRFGQQAHVLASIFRDYGLVAKIGEDEFTAEEIEELAATQTAEEDQDEKLHAAYEAYHGGYSVRANTRALRFSAALKAVRGLVAGNAAAKVRLKDAQFKRGGGRKKKGTGTPTGGGAS
jgi:predicted secreted protein